MQAPIVDPAHGTTVFNDYREIPLSANGEIISPLNQHGLRNWYTQLTCQASGSMFVCCQLDPLHGWKSQSRSIFQFFAMFGQWPSSGIRHWKYHVHSLFGDKPTERFYKFCYAFQW